MGSFPQDDHPHTLHRYATLAASLGLSGEDDNAKFETLLGAIRTLKRDVGILDSIAAYDINEHDFLATLDEMVKQAFDDQCTGANPRYPLMHEIKQLYLNAYYGS